MSVPAVAREIVLEDVVLGVLEHVREDVKQVVQLDVQVLV